VVYEIGKSHRFEPLRDWFKAIYEVALGQTQGPRFGSFAALFGCDKTAVLIRTALCGCVCSQCAKLGRSLAAAYRLMVLCLAFAAPSGLGRGKFRAGTVEKGEYAKAIDTAAAEGGGVGFALAARATLCGSLIARQSMPRMLEARRRLCRQAIAADPDNLEGQLQLAVALGFRRASSGLARAVSALSRTGQDRHRNRASSRARQSLGARDCRRVSDRSGALGRPAFGKIYFTAQAFDDGVAYYQRAIGADPSNAVIKLQYALALTSYGFDARRAEIAAVLDSASRVSAPDAYGKAMKTRAAGLVDLLNHNKREEISGAGVALSRFPSKRDDHGYKILRETRMDGRAKDRNLWRFAGRSARRFHPLSAVDQAARDGQKGILRRRPAHSAGRRRRPIGRRSAMGSLAGREKISAPLRRAPRSTLCNGAAKFTVDPTDGVSFRPTFP